MLTGSSVLNDDNDVTIHLGKKGIQREDLGRFLQWWLPMEDDLPMDVVVHFQSRMRIRCKHLSWSHRLAITIEATVGACVVIIGQQSLLLLSALRCT